MNALMTVDPAVVAEHPHALLLVLVRHVLVGLQQRRDLGDTGYRADPEHFAMQMGVFDRMRETEREFRQRAKGGGQ